MNRRSKKTALVNFFENMKQGVLSPHYSEIIGTIHEQYRKRSFPLSVRDACLHSLRIDIKEFNIDDLNSLSFYSSNIRNCYYGNYSKNAKDWFVFYYEDSYVGWNTYDDSGTVLRCKNSYFDTIRVEYLSRIDARHSSFSDARLEGYFTNTESNIQDCQITLSSFSNIHFNDVSFSSFMHSSFSNSSFKNVSASSFYQTKFHKCNFDGCVFSDVMMEFDTEEDIDFWKKNNSFVGATGEIETNYGKIVFEG